MADHVLLKDHHFTRSPPTDSASGPPTSASHAFSLGGGNYSVNVTAGFNPGGAVNIEQEYLKPLPGRAGGFVKAYRTYDPASANSKKPGGASPKPTAATIARNGVHTIALPKGNYRVSTLGANAGMISLASQ